MLWTMLVRTIHGVEAEDDAGDEEEDGDDGDKSEIGDPIHQVLALERLDLGLDGIGAGKRHEVLMKLAGSGCG